MCETNKNTEQKEVIKYQEDHGRRKGMMRVRCGASWCPVVCCASNVRMQRVARCDTIPPKGGRREEGRADVAITRTPGVCLLLRKFGLLNLSMDWAEREPTHVERPLAVSTKLLFDIRFLTRNESASITKQLPAPKRSHEQR